ncbi:hypothetical protein JVT61DRAFT_10941 [Boletus reticuloceps]|uniref:Uncharacterized protein n=1 Tax=Boletus reticuloceps TaxID=495285 RepID=A0A8I2YFF3_9AGAM|nr:hypothetical protein JVT61DRAFT_10941 [Boletus reticuloceps]
MLTVIPRASLKRSPRARTRKNTASTDTDIVCPPLRSSSLLDRRKTRPPPLQIIPEYSESEPEFDATHSPATARPMLYTPRQSELVSSRITLSAYAFSIDDALLMIGGDAPLSPALSASSSTSDGASSEGVPTTPGASDDEVGRDFILPTSHLRPRRITIRPLCITKTRSSIYQEDEVIHNYFDKVTSLSVTEEMTEHPAEDNSAMEAAEEAEQDFYTREFEDFISLLPAISPATSPARRDSLTLVTEASLAIVEVPEPKPRGRNRHSKPLPLLPPATPPASSFPPILITQKSVVRRKRNIPSLPSYPPPPSPGVSRPLPRMSVPLDIEDCIFPEENFDVQSRQSNIIEQVHDVEEDASIYSQPSIAYTLSDNARLLPPAIPETPLAGMYGEVKLPRSSTDSDAPRSSVDTTSSFTSSTSSNTPPTSPISEEGLRSRWSSSTLASLAAEPPRGTTLLLPLRNVFSSRARRVPPPRKMLPHPTPPKLPKNKHSLAATPSPPNKPGKHVRQQGSRSSTSSAGTSASECNSRDGSPSGLKRKPILVPMFLRTM